MGGCFVKEEPINPALSGLNDSRHVMMRRSSKIEPPPSQEKKKAPAESAYRPRPQHRLPPDLEKAFDMDDDDNGDGGGGKK